MTTAVRRVAVLFKSVCHSAIFVIEDERLTLPGGEVIENGTYEAAALREVKEGIGVWPSSVSDDITEVVHVDVGDSRYYLLNVDLRACFSQLSPAYSNKRSRGEGKYASLEIHHIGVVCAGTAPYAAHPHLFPLFIALREQQLLSGAACDVVDEVAEQLATLRCSVSEVAAPAPALEDAAAASSQSATPAVPAAPAPARVAAAGSGRDVRQAPARAGRQPTRRREDYFHCRLCNTPLKQLRLCWECNTWACSKCSFWCTLCPKGIDKYNICEECHSTGWYLWKKQGKVWSCWNCW